MLSLSYHWKRFIGSVALYFTSLCLGFCMSKMQLFHEQVNICKMCRMVPAHRKHSNVPYYCCSPESFLQASFIEYSSFALLSFSPSRFLHSGPVSFSMFQPTICQRLLNLPLQFWLLFQIIFLFTGHFYWKIARTSETQSVYKSSPLPFSLASFLSLSPVWVRDTQSILKPS